MNPKDTGFYIAQHCTHIKINWRGVKKAAELAFEALDDNSIGDTSWTATHQIPENCCPVNWCFFVNAINFSFWTSEGTFRVTDNGVQETGYKACCYLFNKAIRNGIPLTKAEFYNDLTLEKLTEIFTSDDGTVIPMINERYECLVDSAKNLNKIFKGSFLNCIIKSNSSAQKLLGLILDYFPSFRDVSIFNRVKVSFLKRAQILVYDVYDCLQGKEPANFADIDSLTMFADYRVPQVLVYLGALEYSDELQEKLKREQLFTNGEPMEVEIRGCTLHAVHLITKEVKNLLTKSGQGERRINAAMVDNFLWCYRRANAKKLASIPFHRTRCIYY